MDNQPPDDGLARPPKKSREEALKELSRLVRAAGADHLEPFLDSLSVPTGEPDPSLGGAFVEVKIGAQVGNYRIESSIGQGGMGVVYLGAKIGSENLKVALKVLTYTQPGYKDLFLKECAILATLKHPNIAQLIDTGFLPDGRPWLAMEYVDGLRLDDYLAQQDHPIDDRLELFIKICDGLSHAHQRMVIHRDIKPKNILVTEDGFPKILDFGIAVILKPDAEQASTVTQLAEQMMTPEYASPEQVNGLRLGAASDVYSMGIMLYEMLTGVKPYQFGSSGISEILRVVNHTTITKPSSVRIEGHSLSVASTLRGDLDTIVLKALERDPERRYPSMESFAADIRFYMEGLPVQARPATAMYRLQKLVQRHPWPIAMGVGTLVFLLLFAVFAQYQAALVAAERDVAKREQRTAEQVTQFLVGMFEQVDPDLAQTQEVTAYQIMEQGRGMVDQSLNDQPEVQIQLQASMGQVYRALGDYQVSRALLEEALRKIEDPSAAVVQKLELVDTIMLAGDYEDAQRLLAALIHEPIEHKNSVARARIDHLNGKLLFLTGRFKEASEAFQRAQIQRGVLPVSDQIGLDEDQIALYAAWGFPERAVALQNTLLENLHGLYGETHSAIARGLARLGELYFEKGDFDEAGNYYDRAEAVYGKLYSDEHPAWVDCRLRRARLLEKRARFDAAEAQLTSALALAEKHLGPNHPKVVSVNLELSRFYLHQGLFEASEKHWQAARDVAEKELVETHPERSAVVLQRARFLRRLGRLDEALAMNQEVVKQRFAQYGEAHPKSISALRNLAASYLDMNDNQAAHRHASKALSLAEEVLGHEHPDTVSLMSSVATTLFQLNRIDEARILQEDQLALNEKIYGPNHPKMAMALRGWARFLEMTVSPKAAVAPLERAVAIEDKAYHKPHPQAAITLEALAKAYAAVDEDEKAMAAMERSVAIGSGFYGADHPQTAMMFESLATLYFSKDDFENALKSHKKSLAINLKVYGEEHGSVARNYHNIATNTSGAGDRPSGLKYMKKALEIRRKVFGEDHFEVAISLEGVGQILSQMGRLQEALPYLEEAYRKERKGLGDDHPELAYSMTSLGSLYRKMNQYEKARPLLVRAAKLREEKLGEGHRLTMSSLVRMGQFHFEAGELEVAIPFLDRVIDLYAKYQRPSHDRAIEARRHLAGVHFALRDYDAAERVIEEALQLTEERDDDIAKILVLRGKIAEIRGFPRKAIADWQEALTVYEGRRGSPGADLPDVLDLIGNLLQRLGDTEESRAYLQRSAEIRAQN
ncbi:serine/threonine-protein kinase [Acanthopleuribacter pedis]|uniref:Tetratricopeptide repeat protein n=1 Tax=Acanthopleuribacter pedis TaxID=442870 RepID=A0A8J7QBF4_9BACT|nr:serine/threonine-protein kinase [Acanthopleuribacter pedis]MBO1323047.1 tetratricopeptide repeat protein [Acanthopleuribacter pedis]